MARPRKRKGEIIDGLKQAFRSDCNVLTACNWVGISKSTYYSWLKIDRRFNDEMDVCRRLHAEGRTMTEEEEIEEHHRKDMQKAMKCLRNKRIRE